MLADWWQVARDTKGWLEDDEAKLLHTTALLTDGPYGEIGSYCGKSACWLGAAAREKNTVLFAIDHHRGSPEMRPGNDCHDPELMDDLTGLHDSLPWFRDTILAANLEKWVVPVVGNSVTVGRWWQTPLSFLFVDGAHDDDGVSSDARLWAPWVTGFIAFHDTTIPGIGNAVASLAGFELHAEAGSLKVLRRC